MLLLRVVDFDALQGRVGKPCSDEVLRIIAERLHEGVPEPNLVTRLRAGDFAIVLRDLGPEVSAETLATRLLERAGERCASGDRVLECAVVGALVLWGGRHEAALMLLERASRVLAHANLRPDVHRHHGLGLG